MGTGDTQTHRGDMGHIEHRYETRKDRRDMGTNTHGDKGHTNTQGRHGTHIGHTERHETHIEQGHTDMRHAIPETFTRQTLRDKKSHIRWVLPKIALSKT